MPVRAKTIREALSSDRWTVDEETGCWIWRGALNRKGYGYLYAEGKSLRPHRAMYELFYGPVASEHQIHHRCCVPACVNPEHLESLSERDHRALHVGLRRGSSCRRGHERTPENAYDRDVPGRGRQVTCRVCDRERQRAHYAARTAA